MKPKNSNPFSHGSHNYRVCHELEKIGDCNDWVITTAFYSALKFMEDKLFPQDYKHPRKYGEIQSFKTFYNYISAHGNLDGSNKHKIMSELIQEHVPDTDVVDSYEDLKSACHTARYINYEVGDDRLKMCKDALELVKNFCVS